MNGFKIKNLWTERLLLLFTAIYFIGMKTFMAPCGPKDDGSFMICRWSSQAVSGLALTLLILALLHFILKDPQAKLGLSLAMIPLTLLSAFVPGNLIPLCMMNTMRCHTVMKPAVIVCSIFVIATAILDILVQKSAANPSRASSGKP